MLSILQANKLLDAINYDGAREQDNIKCLSIIADYYSKKFPEAYSVFKERVINETSTRTIMFNYDVTDTLILRYSSAILDKFKLNSIKELVKGGYSNNVELFTEVQKYNDSVLEYPDMVDISTLPIEIEKDFVYAILDDTVFVDLVVAMDYVALQLIVNHIRKTKYIPLEIYKKHVLYNHSCKELSYNYEMSECKVEEIISAIRNTISSLYGELYAQLYVLPGGIVTSLKAKNICKDSGYLVTYKPLDNLLEIESSDDISKLNLDGATKNTLSRRGFKSVNELAKYVKSHGSYWYKDLCSIGAERAMRVEMVLKERGYI